MSNTSRLLILHFRESWNIQNALNINYFYDHLPKVYISDVSNQGSFSDSTMPQPWKEGEEKQLLHLFTFMQ